METRQKIESQSKIERLLDLKLYDGLDLSNLAEQATHGNSSVGQIFAFSPDGSRLVYRIAGGEGGQLYLREMDQLENLPIPGTENAVSPFFSPDSQWVGFKDRFKLKKVSLSGAPPVTLCDIGPLHGAAWGLDKTIIYAPHYTGGLYQVSAAGGSPKLLTTPAVEKGERRHGFPHILPGGKAVLFTIGRRSTYEDAQIAVLSLETGKWKTVLEGGAFARYSPTGHLVYMRSNTLMAVRFDLTKLDVTGDPAPVLEDIYVGNGPYFTFSRNGTLVYLPRTATFGDRSLLWVDRQGKVQPMTQTQRNFAFPRLSPDGKRLAVTLAEGSKSRVWICETARGILTPFGPEKNRVWPTWTPDGKRLTFASDLNGVNNIFWMAADGSGEAERLTTSETGQLPESWSPDGKVLAFLQWSEVGLFDIWVLPFGGERKPQPFQESQFMEMNPCFSPDGRWIAFNSNQSGRGEVYVKPYPGPGGMVPISTDGGWEPRWPANGEELFYRYQDKLMAVSIQTEPELKVERPRILFKMPQAQMARWWYDVTPDGQQFVMTKRSESGVPTQLNVVQNWFKELKRRVPTN